MWQAPAVPATQKSAYLGAQRFRNKFSSWSTCPAEVYEFLKRLLWWRTVSMSWRLQSVACIMKVITRHKYYSVFCTFSDCSPISLVPFLQFILLFLSSSWYISWHLLSLSHVPLLSHWELQSGGLTHSGRKCKPHTHTHTELCARHWENLVSAETYAWLHIHPVVWWNVCLYVYNYIRYNTEHDKWREMGNVFKQRLIWSLIYTELTISKHKDFTIFYCGI